MDHHELIEQIIKQIEQPIWSNWIIKEKIGTGNFSEVYKIEANRGGRIDYAALKIEPLVATETVYVPEDKKIYIEREWNKAKNESDIMYKLRNCPYVVRYEEELKEKLYINGQFEGYYFLIRMEYLTCVHDMLQKKTLELSEKNIKKLAIDIGKGISAAHKKDIIHRDIKPNNLFFSQENIYKLGDFNISKQLDTARTLAGTDGFIAPEIYQAKRNPNDSYTKQVDIYSFGITLYFLMNNLRFPFEDKLNYDLAFDKRMLGEKLPKPQNAFDKFGEIILKACEFNPKGRYQSVDEMISDLENLDVGKEAAYIPKAVDLLKDENRTVYADSPNDDEGDKRAKGKELREFTLEEQKLFENFAVTKKIKEQIIYALENMTLAPHTGNVIITGDIGIDTERMAKNLIYKFQTMHMNFSGKVAKISGEKLNQRNSQEVFEKLNNGGLIIEKANGMTKEKLYEMALCLSQDNLGILVIMEDTKKEIAKLLEKQAMIVDYFDIRIDLMRMDDNALVAYAKNYASALEYSIDELGILALYNRIAIRQSENHVVTKAEVREIIDEAICNSKKSKTKNFVDILFAKRYDNEDKIILKERDFF